MVRKAPCSPDSILTLSPCPPQESQLSGHQGLYLWEGTPPSSALSKDEGWECLSSRLPLGDSEDAGRVSQECVPTTALAWVS